MRDEADPGLIELLEADPAAFGSGSGAAATTRAELPRWWKPTAIVVTLVIVVAAVLVWRPWHHQPDPPLSNRLLLDRPTREVFDVRVDRVAVGPAAGEVGYVFADEGAILPWMQAASGRSVVWTSYAVDSTTAAYGTLANGNRQVADVQGADARMWTDEGWLRVVFGPLAGRMFDLTSNGLTEAEATAFAEAIGVERGRPVLRDDDVLLGLRPVGTYEHLGTALGILGAGYGAGYGEPTGIATTSVGYVDGVGSGGAVRITSVPDAGGGLLAMVGVLASPTTGATVHRRPATVADIQLLSSEDQSADSLVAWQEGGRLIVVTGSADLPTTIAIAETAHEATEDEWAQVAAQASPPAHFSTPSTIGFRRSIDGSVTEVWATFPGPGHLAVCVSDLFSTSDDCATETDLRLPFLKIMRIHTMALVVAVVKAGSVTAPSVEAQLHVTHDDGSVDIHLLFQPGGALPGPAVAVFLPDDMREATLVVDGEVVATL